MPILAFTRDVSPSLAHCELTHLARQPIDVPRARSQHASYERLLADLGCTVQRVASAPEQADAVFVEDTTVVLPTLAVMARPGAESRRAEVEAVAAALGAYRPLAHIRAPGTLDGGDVLRAGRTLFVGRSTRTNDAGIAQLATLARPHGLTVCQIEVTGALHLKSAVTAVSDDTMLINPEWVRPAMFPGWRILEVDRDEPAGANALRLGKALVYGAAFPRTRARLVAAGCQVHTVDVSELAKAEGAVTCCSGSSNSDGSPGLGGDASDKQHPGPRGTDLATIHGSSVAVNVSTARRHGIPAGFPAQQRDRYPMRTIRESSSATPTAQLPREHTLCL